ncbi:MAG: hypothetical protein IJW51_07345 [Clostridia bacterium]|nr:hypothetical protein [Clostridia bacterium]
MKILSLTKKLVLDKSHWLACLCFVLAVVMCLLGGISYSKYIAANGANKGAAIARFSCSASITGASALTFTNADFWSETQSGDILAMNPLRSLNFTVRNYDEQDGEQVVSELALRYTLMFATPANFAQELAIQLFDGANNSLIPQVSLPALMAAAPTAGSSGEFSTADYNYNGAAADDLVFTVTQAADGTYTATQKGAAQPIVITLAPTQITRQQTIFFRLWDVSEITNSTAPSVNAEAGSLAAPLQIKYTAEVPYYNINISLPGFTLPAGVATAKDYSIHLAPLTQLEDTHLDTYCADLDGNALKTVYGGQQIMLKPNNVEGNKDGAVYITIDEAAQQPEGADTPTVFTAGAPLSTWADGLQKIFISKCYSKSYPLSVDVYFEQTLTV